MTEELAIATHRHSVRLKRFSFTPGLKQVTEPDRSPLISGLGCKPAENRKRAVIAGNLAKPEVNETQADPTYRHRGGRLANSSTYPNSEKAQLSWIFVLDRGNA
jgi:hypothetical protein